MVDSLKKFALFTAVVGVLASIIGGILFGVEFDYTFHKLFDAEVWPIAVAIVVVGSFNSIASGMMMYGYATIVEFCENNMYLYKNVSENANRVIKKEDDELPEL